MNFVVFVFLCLWINEIIKPFILPSQNIFLFQKKLAIITLQLSQYCDVISLLKVGHVTVCLSPSWSPVSRPRAATCLWPNWDPTVSSTASRPPTSRSRGASPPTTSRDVTASKVKTRHVLFSELPSVYFLNLNTISKSWPLELPCAFPCI